MIDWTEQEIAFLKANFQLLRKELAEKLGKKYGSIRHKVRTLNCLKDSTGRKWTKEDIELVDQT